MSTLQTLFENVVAGYPFSYEDGLGILQSSNDQLEELLTITERLTRRFVGNEVLLCGIVNAKSGKCSEDCSFCSQSAHHQTTVEVYPLKEKAALVEAQQRSKQQGVSCFSIVTAGKSVTEGRDFDTIVAALSDFEGTYCCASLGILTKDQLRTLKAAGMDKFHHNLETARSFFPNMCTTHTYDERVQTIRDAKDVGLQVCSGGIFGLGESLQQRVELAMELRELDVDSVPINILYPIEGTRVYEQAQPVTPQDVLRLIAMFRWVMPTKIIGVFGGRERSLGDLQPMIFRAGANAMLVGNYLTTTGDPVEKDMQMIRGLGLTPLRPATKR